MGHHLSFLLARLIRYEDFVKTSSFLICTWAIVHSPNPPFAIRPHGQVFNLTADVWVLKKNDLKHFFLCFFFLWCMMWYLDILMPIPKPKVSRFGQINTARLWREWEQAEAAEVGLVRGLQFRFERNWGEDRSIDVANELQSKLSATFFQRKLQIWLIWSSMQLLCWQMNIIYGVSSPFVLVQTIFTLSLRRGPQWILGRIIPWFAACVFSGTKVDSFTGRFRSRLKLLKLTHGVFIRDTYSNVNVNVLY